MAPKLKPLTPILLCLGLTMIEAYAMAKPQGVIIGMSDVQRAMSFDQGCRYTLIKLGVATNQTLEQTLEFCEKLTNQTFEVRKAEVNHGTNH